MQILDAVNEILEAIGEPPATELDTGGTSEIAEAEKFLDRENKRIQEDGWHINTVEKMYTPNHLGRIPLPDVLKFEPVDQSAWLKLTIRNGNLYDLENDTDDFTDQTIVAEVVELLPFIHLTPKLQTYIVKAAALRFERYKKRGQLDEAVFGSDLLDARVKAIQEDTDASNINLLDTAEARKLKGDRQNYATS